MNNPQPPSAGHPRLSSAPLWLLAVAVGLSACATPKQTTDMRQTKQTAKVLNTTTTERVKVKYLLFLPDNYRPRSRERWPLIFFLHGMGERGNDTWKVKVHGPPKIAERMSNFPFIVVSPQCPDGEWWSNHALATLLDDVIAKYKVDTNRIYLTGLSMGGFGSWSLAMEFPQRFAAVAPICGGGNPLYPHAYNDARKAALKSLPFWAFHGDKDQSVALEESERMVDGLKKFGCETKLTVYPGVGHDCWTETYNNPALYDWFLAHQRKSGK